MITLTGTRDQITAISDLPAVRSIYGNRTLNLNSEPEVRAVTGVERAWRDAEITTSNHNLPVTGRNVTVAVLDTGVDGNHGDLAGRVAKNIKLAGTQSASVGFNYPINSESLQQYRSGVWARHFCRRRDRRQWQFVSRQICRRRARARVWLD